MVYLLWMIMLSKDYDVCVLKTFRHLVLIKGFSSNRKTKHFPLENENKLAFPSKHCVYLVTPTTRNCNSCMCGDVIDECYPQITLLIVYLSK